MAIRELGMMAWSRQVVAARPRLFVGLMCGIAAYFALGALGGSRLRAILAWDVGVAVYLAGAALLFAREHLGRMEADARRQQEGEWTIFSLTLAGVIASFAAIVGEFSNTANMPRATKNLHIAVVAATLFASWLMTQTSFAFRYAHEYYSRDGGGPHVDGGLQFPEEPRPDYLDFMYFALVLGMTFQVSDVQITARKMRRLAAVHGLLGFLFNTIIIALTVNIAAGLL